LPVSRKKISRNYRQPKDAIDAAAFSLEAAENWALERSRKRPARLFRLTSLWHIDYERQYVPQERKVHYSARLAQSENYGIAFGPPPAAGYSGRELVGQDVRQILQQRLWRDAVERAALIDLLMGHVAAGADQMVALADPLPAKYAGRSRLFAAEAARALRRKGARNLKGKRPHVLVIGATAGILRALVRRRFAVSATDQGSDVIGQSLAGVEVESGDAANGLLIAEADLAIVTGMTFANHSLPHIMAAAKAHNTSTLIWAITGRNFGRYYTAHGVDCVISDPSPFLTLPGRAMIAVSRRRT